ncbi:MAG: hypothetical protein WC556_05245 [Candidatus Methanoperedens sp.]
MSDIKTFLAKSPSVTEILEFVEEESSRIVAERKQAPGRAINE